jgi:hypothetical protein
MASFKTFLIKLSSLKSPFECGTAFLFSTTVIDQSYLALIMAGALGGIVGRINWQLLNEVLGTAQAPDSPNFEFLLAALQGAIIGLLTKTIMKFIFAN